MLTNLVTYILLVIIAKEIIKQAAFIQNPMAKIIAFNSLFIF